MCIFNLRTKPSLWEQTWECTFAVVAYMLYILYVRMQLCIQCVRICDYMRYMRFYCHESMLIIMYIFARMNKSQVKKRCLIQLLKNKNTVLCALIEGGPKCHQVIKDCRPLQALMYMDLITPPSLRSASLASPGFHPVQIASRSLGYRGRPEDKGLGSAWLKWKLWSFIYARCYRISMRCQWMKRGNGAFCRANKKSRNCDVELCLSMFAARTLSRAYVFCCHGALRLRRRNEPTVFF